ncbi:hypothetical protein C8R43DRAFT_964368 [Mycena crocata]|nr:hypothetical protein C8R43DRAFT_964368 [Mycena crocata]
MRQASVKSRTRKFLSREERALCRFLLNHDVPCVRIAGELNCSNKTVQRLKRGEHTSTDNKSEDAKYIGSRAREILHKLQKTPQKKTTKALPSPSRSGGTNRKQTQQEPGGQDPRTRRSRCQTPAPAYPGNELAFRTYLFTVLTRFSQEKAFLREFHDISFTDSTLDEHRKLTRDELRSVLTERFPAMSVINRFILEDALWVWMRAVEIVCREQGGRV